MGDRLFHRTYWPFFLSLVLQNIITIGVSLVDNIMLGGYNEAALAGAAAVNQIHFILYSVVGGAGDGLMVLNSQYWGQKRTEPIQRLTATALWLSLSLAMVLFTVVSLFPHATLRLFTTSELIIQQGVEYLSIIRFTFPIFALSTVLIAMLRSVETVKITVVISLIALCNSGLLNYMFIYGNFGAPAMGAKGAAISTLISRILELTIIVGFLVLGDKKIKARIRLLLKPDKQFTKDYFRVSIPTLIIGLQWGINTALQTVILGHMTDSAIAANSISVNLVMMLKILAISSAVSAGVLIGKTVGQGDLDKVRYYSKTLQRIFLCIGVVSFAGIILLRAPILSLYAISDETKNMAWSFLSVLAVTTVGMSYQMPVLTGIVRGGGDTRFVMINDLISVWGIVIPLSFMAAFVFKWTPVAVIACLHSDQIFKCIPAAIKVNRYNWIRKLTRDPAQSQA